MRTSAIALVAGLALLAVGCGKQTAHDTASGSTASTPTPQAQVGINNPNIEKHMKCVAAIPNNESAQQQAKDGELCDKKYPLN